MFLMCNWSILEAVRKLDLRGWGEELRGMGGGGVRGLGGRGVEGMGS